MADAYASADASQPAEASLVETETVPQPNWPPNGKHCMVAHVVIWMDLMRLRAGSFIIIILLDNMHVAAAEGQTVSTAVPVDSAQTATVQPVSWFVHLGPTGLIFDWDAHPSIEGRKVPGGNVSVKNNSGVEVELGYFISPHLSLSIDGGLPLTTKTFGEGSLKSEGELATITYGPVAAQFEYHINIQRFHPYAGLGIAYTTIFNADDRALRRVSLSDSVGPLLVVGADYDLSQHLGVYFDFKKVWSYTDTRFEVPTPIGNLPGKSRIQLDPFVLSAGLAIRF